MKLSIAQTCPTDGPLTFFAQDLASPSFDVFANVKQNLVAISESANKARQHGSELVVFPEYFTQGSLDGRGYLAQPARYILQELQEIARQLNIAIAGTIVEPDQPGSQPEMSPFQSAPNDLSSVRKAWTETIRQTHPEAFNNVHSHPHVNRSTDEKDLPQEEGEADSAKQKLLNVAYFIKAGTGEIIGRYVKRNLWISEREYLHPGSEEHAVFQWRDITVGFLICWDLAHPLAAQVLAKQGADLIIAPTYWLSTDSQPSIGAYDPPEDYEYQLLQSLAYTRAFETETALAMCNAGGNMARGLMGGSGVWMPFRGKLRAQSIESGDEGNTTDLRHYEVDLGMLPVARKTYKIREDWERVEDGSSMPASSEVVT